MPADDSDIRSQDPLWRGISRNLQPACVYDEGLQRWRPSSVVFEKGAKDKMISVWIKAEVLKSRRQPVDLIKEPWIGIVQITARQIRNQKLGIYKDPKPDEPAHANVFDKLQNRTTKEWKNARETLARQAVWIIRPAACE